MNGDERRMQLTNKTKEKKQNGGEWGMPVTDKGKDDREGRESGNKKGNKEREVRNHGEVI